VLAFCHSRLWRFDARTPDHDEPFGSLGSAGERETRVNAPLDTPAREASVEERAIEFPAHDGYTIAGTIFRRVDDYDPDDVLIFSTGAGLAVRRYRHFLRFLASRGYPVLAYDYRGVGGSRPHRLRGFKAGLEDWTEFDHAGAIDDMRTRYPRALLTTVAHSIGCLIACSAPNAADQSRLVLIAPHTGYWRDYAPGWKLPMTVMWHGIMPLVARLVGYFPGRRLSIGDDFPLRFALQWSGRTTAAFLVDPRDARAWTLLGNAEMLAAPVIALCFSDDAFASRAGVERLLSLVPRARVETCELDARKLGRRIGHFGFFSRRNEALWELVPRSIRGMEDLLLPGMKMSFRSFD
jgi:predicted alpha/beta hydrolase